MRAPAVLNHNVWISFAKGTRMMKLWRPLAYAVALVVWPGAVAARAHSVMVRDASAGSRVEVLVNGAPAGTAAADAAGTATIPFKLPQPTRDIDAYLFVDVCGETYRLLITERGQPVPAQLPDCARRESLGLFLLRPVSTIVLRLGDQTPTVMLRQGTVTFGPRRLVRPTAFGPVLFAGGGFTSFRDTNPLACGNAPNCSGEDWRLTGAIGADFWFRPFAAVEAAYVKTDEVTAQGSGDTYRFSSFTDPHLFTIASKIGIPMQRGRIYGKVGGNYHRARAGVVETFDPVTVTIDGVEETIEGGTQGFELETDGWGWTFGGGGELWIRPRLALYGEFDIAALKGEAIGGAEGIMDERVTSFMFGLRFGLGR